MKNNISIKSYIDKKLDKEGIVILPPMDACGSAQFVGQLGYRPTMTMLDPWYNRGVGGVREDYVSHILEVIECIQHNTEHFFLWGFPEIVARFVDKVDAPLEFVTWITWFFKNCPSVTRGWRSSQQACLHFATSKAKMHPENFFNSQQELRYNGGKMRFIPGPNTVIEEPLLVGFVGKKEQTGHPAQKPEKVYERLLLISTEQGDLVFDLMAGSGTMGAVCRKHGRKCILSDISDEYLTLMEKRLGVKRLPDDVLSLELAKIA